MDTATQNPPSVLDARISTAIAEAEAEEKLFELQQRRIKPYAQSDLVPASFRGNIGNCMIAFDMAKRMQANILAVMQNLYVVHGNPSWSAKFAIAMFNTCGRFSAIRYRFDGEGDDYGCTAYASELATGDVVESPKITWKLVKAEGWLGKAGSKWKTMPDLMFRYRAAAYLIATTAPELLNGLRTREEEEDVYRASRKPAKSDSVADAVAAAVQVDAEVSDPAVTDRETLGRLLIDPAFDGKGVVSDADAAAEARAFIEAEREAAKAKAAKAKAAKEGAAE